MKLSIGERVKYKMNYNGIVDDYDAVVVDNIDCVRIFVYLPDGVKHDTTLIKEQLKYITKGEKNESN